MPLPKQLKDMDCIEALEALKEGLRNLNLPAISLYERFIDHAEKVHEKEVNKAYNAGVDSIVMHPDYLGTIGGLSGE